MVSSGELDINKCLEAQVEEIEVICSIYGDEWKIENEADRSYSIEIKHGNASVILYVTLPTSYPYYSPPTFALSAPDLVGGQKNQLTAQLEEVYMKNIGQPVLFQWIDKIKEYLSSLVLNLGDIPEVNLPVHSEQTISCSSDLPNITHGEQITDRKSTFQGHVSAVLSVDEVKKVLNELKKNKKIAKATHNIYAYRISHSDKCIIQDCDDDGETSAGSRLLHLLQILNVNNVLVVVSRWYGGILLGGDRFRHINNAARQALEQAGLINTTKKKT